MNKELIPAEVAEAMGWLIGDVTCLVIAVTVMFLIGLFLPSTNILLFYVGMGVAVTIILLFNSPKYFKYIRTVMWWNEHKDTGLPDNTEFPDWAYSSFERRSAIRLINTMDGRKFNTRRII